MSADTIQLALLVIYFLPSDPLRTLEVQEMSIAMYGTTVGRERQISNDATSESSSSLRFSELEA